MATTISYIIPLGNRCVVAGAFKDKSLRRFSLPFDWIYSIPSMIISVLNDDFSSLLDHTQYYRVQGDRRNTAVGHRALGHHVASMSEAVFVHHDVMTKEGYAYLRRSVERWRRVMAAPERKLFAMAVIDDGMWNLAACRDLFDALSTRTSNFCFIAVRVLQGKGKSGWECVEREEEGEEEFIVVEQRCIGSCAGQHYAISEDADVLAQILLFPPPRGGASNIRDPYDFKLKTKSQIDAS